MVEKNKIKKSNKIYYIVGAVLLLFILFFVFLSFSGKEIPIISHEKAFEKLYDLQTGTKVVLNLTNETNYLRECINVNGLITSERPSGLKECPPVKKEDIKKFEYISNLSGEIVCNSFNANDNGDLYKRCLDIVVECEKLLSYDWISPGDKDIESYHLHTCKYGYYYLYSHQDPKENVIVKVDMDWFDFRQKVYGY